MSNSDLRFPPDLFRLVIEGTEDFAIFLIDPSGRHVSLWNVGAERIFGYPAEEMIGHDPAVIFTAEDRASGVPERELEKARSDGKAADNRWHKRKDGSLFFADGVMTALRFEGNLAGFAKVCTDATERHLAEQRLAMELELHTILSAEGPVPEIAAAVLENVCERFGWSAGGLWQVDAGLERLNCTSVWHRDEKAHDFMKALCNVSSFERAEGAPGKVWESGEAIWLSDLPADHRYATTSREFGMGLGLAFPLMVSHRVIGVMEFFSQSNWPPRGETETLMTILAAQLGSYLERNRTAQQLADTRQRYRVIAETAQDAIFTIDRKSTILFANTAAGQLFGYAPGELAGKQLHTIMPDRFRKDHDRGLSRYIQSGRRNIPWSGVELPGLHRDGTEIPLEIAFGASGEGESQIFTGFARDIRERKRIESEREKLLADSEEANRAKDMFLAVVSHELRTPMTSILGWIEIMEQDHGHEETFRTAMEMIRNSAGMQSQLIEDILDVSRIVLGKLRLEKREFELGSVVHAATHSLMPAAQAKQIELAESVSEEIRIVADPGRLQQVVWNLLSNAIKFTPEEGKITVRLGRRGDDAEISVSDTGTGISGELLEKLFDPFRQAENSPGKGGLGLGLAIVKQIVELHGGTVAAESDGAGAGARFTVRLPLSGEEPEADREN